ncbi:uncharacterized protein UV8b_03821 [Ustilaginoidea virens]|uniref:Rhomboid-type serine protease n=1 Tax=Ustilaginoidea virens TaxID=1159556 RepID=A0A8E5HQ27_USTVR|nr:uncharacterized protein UV8b_03821 [Ustilaginoidea virens]QUC19580.1 hypothetical protein UV8b_03821 [Ustilaginoidea virens]
MAANSQYYQDSNNNNHHHHHPPSYRASPPHSSEYSNHPSTDSHLPVQTPYDAVGSSSSSSSTALAPRSQNQQTALSPFATVFDDNHASGSGSSNSLPHPGNWPDTTYYAQGGPSPARSTTQDNIPLQDRRGKTDDVVDHIYDVPENETAAQARRKKKGVRVGELGMLAGKKGIPWVCYVFSIVQVGVFIGEVVKNAVLTGSPIMIRPQFNPMIGPSTGVLINMGARYVPCMHNVEEIQGSNVTVLFPCPNATRSDQFCPLSEVCGFGGVPNPTFNNAAQDPQPNQWFRFIVPMFMHAGLIHIGFNLLLQLTLAKEMEQVIGSIRFFLVYISAGIFGFVMGGNFAAPGIASTGASGSLFGIIALTLLDLLYSWGERRNPVKDLVFIIMDMVISFVLGLLPGLDNFSHIGGFLMGLALGVCILHSPNALRRKMAGGDAASYSAVHPSSGETAPGFLKSPIGFYKGRKPLWWAWWLVRAGFLIAVIVVFIYLLNNFYNGHRTCSWCKYLSCLPVSNWCDIGTIQKTTTS